MILDNFTKKKVYHFLIEANKKTDRVFFIFRTSEEINNFQKYFLDFLKNKFQNLNFKFETSIPTKINKRDDYIFVFDNVRDLYEFNLDIFGMPGGENLPRDYIDNPLQHYFGNEFYDVVYVDDNMENLDINEEGNFVFIGNKIKCAEIVNKVKFNPVIVHNNFMISDTLKKSKNIRIRNDVEFPYSEFDNKIIRF